MKIMRLKKRGSDFWKKQAALYTYTSLGPTKKGYNGAATGAYQ